MKIDLDKFIAEGVLGGLGSGASRQDVLAETGPPAIDTPQRKSYPAMLVYGDLEFRLRNDRLSAVALNLADDPPNLTAGFELTERSRRDRSDVEAILISDGVEWKTDEIMSGDGTPVLVTARGVHLAFEGERLVRVVAEFGGGDPTLVDRKTE